MPLIQSFAPGKYDLCSLEICDNSGRFPGPSWRLATPWMHHIVLDAADVDELKWSFSTLLIRKPWVPGFLPFPLSSTVVCGVNISQSVKTLLSSAWLVNGKSFQNSAVGGFEYISKVKIRHVLQEADGIISTDSLAPCNGEPAALDALKSGSPWLQWYYLQMACNYEIHQGKKCFLFKNETFLKLLSENLFQLFSWVLV